MTVATTDEERVWRAAEQFARKRTKNLIRSVAVGGSLPEAVASAYLLGLRDAADILRGAAATSRDAEQVGEREP